MRVTIRSCSDSRSTPGGSSQSGSSPSPARIAAPRGLQGKSAEKWAAGAMISIFGLGKMGSEPAPCVAEIGRRKPGLAGAEADQQHLVDQIPRMRLAETIGQRRVDRGHGADTIVLAAGIPVLGRKRSEIGPASGQIGAVIEGEAGGQPKARRSKTQARFRNGLHILHAGAVSQWAAYPSRLARSPPMASAVQPPAENPTAWIREKSA